MWSPYSSRISIGDRNLRVVTELITYSRPVTLTAARFPLDSQTGVLLFYSSFIQVCRFCASGTETKLSSPNSRKFPWLGFSWVHCIRGSMLQNVRFFRSCSSIKWQFINNFNVSRFPTDLGRLRNWHEYQSDRFEMHYLNWTWMKRVHLVSFTDAQHSGASTSRFQHCLLVTLLPRGQFTDA